MEGHFIVTDSNLQSLDLLADALNRKISSLAGQPCNW